MRLRPTQTADARDERKGNAYRTLLLRICDLEYPPGTVLSETALAEEFGISRTPLREVLHQLGFMGLVAPKNGIGTVVTDLYEQQHAELGYLRMLLMGLLPDLLDMSGAKPIAQRFAELKERNLRLLDRQDFNAYGTIGVEIQESIAGLITNREFRTIWDNAYYKHSRFAYKLMKLDWKRCVLGQDTELDGYITALVARDADALAAHARKTLRFWMSFASNDDETTDNPGR